MSATPTPNGVSRPGGYIPTLDGWRAIALLMVVAAHSLLPGFDRLSNLGAMGVDLFFALSGFLICTRLVEERERTGHIHLGRFYLRRAFRLLPAAFLYLATLAILAALGFLPGIRSSLLGSLFFYRNYLPMEWSTGVCPSDWYTTHFWSLAVEEHFYLTFPLLLLVCGSRRAFWVLPILGLGVTVWRELDFAYRWFEQVWSGPEFFFRTDTRFDHLLWGCWMALLRQRYGDRLTGSLWASVGALLLAGSVASALLGHVLVGPPLLVPWIVLGTVLRPASAFGACLEWEPLRWVGRLSYSFYLWQQLFFVGGAGRRISALSAVQDSPGNVLVLLACALASYYLLERPTTRLGHRITRSPAPVGRERRGHRQIGRGPHIGPHVRRRVLTARWRR